MLIIGDVRSETLYYEQNISEITVEQAAEGYLKVDAIEHYWESSKWNQNPRRLMEF